MSVLPIILPGIPCHSKTRLLEPEQQSLSCFCCKTKSCGASLIAKPWLLQTSTATLELGKRSTVCLSQTSQSSSDQKDTTLLSPQESAFVIVIRRMKHHHAHESLGDTFQLSMRNATVPCFVGLLILDQHHSTRCSVQ